MSGNIGVQWLGVDGFTRDLITGPVFLTDQGVLGLDAMEADVYAQSSPTIPGRRRTGWNPKPREISLPVFFQASNHVELIDRSRTWNRGFSVEREGTLVVTVGSSTRWIKAVLDMSATAPLNRDPTSILAWRQVMELIADDPWWKSESIQTSLSAGTTTLTNPGDVQVWPKWKIMGPFSSFTVGNSNTGGWHYIEANLQCNSGEGILVDTDPATQTLARIDSSGAITSRLPWASFARLDFYRLYAGSAQVTARTSGSTGTVSVEFQPAYYRAFG